MSRNKKHEEPESHERWLVSYADFITLLFAFFVVLYSSSQVDNKKIARLSIAIQGGFQELGVFTGTAQGPPSKGKEAPPPLGPKMTIEYPGLEPLVTPGVILTEGLQKDEATLRRELENTLGEEIKKHEVQIRIGREGLIVSLRELGFFNSGEATLLEGAEAKITRIAKILGSRGYDIRVEGHTDNVPIHTATFKSNWELSTARATEVVNLLVDRNGFDPRHISVAGYSEYRPIADNDTEDGRRMNRRVDLVILSWHSPILMAASKAEQHP